MPAVADALLKRLCWDDLDLAHLRRFVEMARDEDLAGLGLRDKPRVTGDRSTASLATAPRQGSADLAARGPLTVCGLPLISIILSVYGGNATAQLRVKDGRAVDKGDILATLTGDPRTLLAAERVILNFLQRLSGIATQTRLYADALGKGRTRLLDTRKTTLGWRMLEKYAVACGGGCFQNAVLAGALRRGLASRGIRMLEAARVPPNDGAISLGQCWVAQRSGRG